MERTERQIWGALIALMEEKPLDKIKVTELTQRAGISRSTFYSYYDSVYDVLQDIEDDFLSHIVDERKVGVENNASVIAENFSYIRDNLKTFPVSYTHLDVYKRQRHRCPDYPSCRLQYE